VGRECCGSRKIAINCNLSDPSIRESIRLALYVFYRGIYMVWPYRNQFSSCNDEAARLGGGTSPRRSLSLSSRFLIICSWNRWYFQSMSLRSSLFHRSTTRSEKYFLTSRLLRYLTIFHEWPLLKSYILNDTRLCLNFIDQFLDERILVKLLYYRTYYHFASCIQHVFSSFPAFRVTIMFTIFSRPYYY